MKKRVASALLAFCLALALLPVNAWAVDPGPTSGSCGDRNSSVNWRLSGGALTISGSGKMENYNSKTIPWYSYIDQITSVTVGKGVTHISSAAFYGCKNLSKANIPAGVTLIADAAFSDCTSLSSIALLDGLETLNMLVFEGCSNLSSITLPSSLLDIGERVFSGCSSLKNIDLPDGLTFIGSAAFSNCSGLTSITIPEGVTSIYESTFAACSNLKSVSIPENVTSIGRYAFADCSSLTRIAIPEKVTSIGYYAFGFCTKLSAIYIPASVETIDPTCLIDTPDLRDIYYGGTEEQWNAHGGPEIIKKTKSTQITVHYNATGLPSAPSDSLQDLINKGTTPIELTENLTLDQTIVVPAGYTGVLDLKGKTITSTANPVLRVFGSLTVIDSTAVDAPAIADDYTVSYPCGSISGPKDGVYVQEGGVFTLESGTIQTGHLGVTAIGNKTGSGAPFNSTVTINGGYVEAQEFAVSAEGNGAKVNITEGVLLSRDNAVVAGNGKANYGGTEISITGGTMIGKITDASSKNGYIACGVYHPQQGNLSISGGSIQVIGGGGILMRGGDLAMSGGVVTASAGSPSGYIGDRRSLVPSGAMVVAEGSGGGYTGGHAVLTGGTFSAEPKKDYIETGYAAVKTTENGRIVYKIEPQASTYTITFDANGGVFSNSPEPAASDPKTILLHTNADGKLVDADGDPIQPPTPVNQYYIFDGWYTRAEGGDKLEESPAFTETKTVYAHWKPVVITFDTNEGVFANQQTTATMSVNSEGKLIWPAQPTRENYIFGGWFDAKEHGTEYLEGANFLHDIILYAHWTKTGGTTDPGDPKTFTISFDLNYTGASGAPEAMTTGTDGKLAALPTSAPTRDGYTFDGWYTAAEDGEKITTETQFAKNTTVYAHWTKNSGTTDPDDPKTFTISFDLNYTGASGAPEAMTTGTDGKLAALPTSDPVRDGYTFNGWYTAAEDGEKITTETQFAKNTTVYAHWTKNSGTTDPGDSKTFTIRFHANGGSGAPEPMTTGTDGKLAALPTSAPTRDGYTFDGWYTAASGGTAVTKETVFDQDSTVYAHWTEQSPSTPESTRYPIYSPGSVSGGRVYVSHSYAAQGTRVTIEISPRSNYELDRLSVINLDTGRAVRLTEYDWDEYTFVMPASAVEIEVSYDFIDSIDHYSSGAYFILAEPQIPTGPNAWYYRDRHIYHINDGLVPDGTPITRDMFLSVLYNLAGSHTNDSTAVGSETNDAQTWATSHNIVPDIYASGLWGPDKALSREQAALLIFGYASYRNYSVSQGSNLSRYTDYSQIRPIARTAMSWVLATNLMPGTTASTLSPQAVLTCGQAGNLIFQFQTNVARTYSYY